MNIGDLQRILTPTEAEELTSLQRMLHQQFEKGGTVEYMNQAFEVSPGVFPPRPDSMGLVQHMIVQRDVRALDVCCGSGVIGLMALQRGAGAVLGLDINPDAVDCAIQNARRLGYSSYDARVSEGLTSLKPEERFDLVTFNPPYRDLPAPSFLEKTMWNKGLSVYTSFFSGIKKHLAPGARIYFAQANFGELKRVQAILDQYGWRAELIHRRPYDVKEVTYVEFFVFEIHDNS